jgi:hypothetical protein
MGVLIHNKVAAMSYNHFFNMMWKGSFEGKEVK